MVVTFGEWAHGCERERDVSMSVSMSVSSGDARAYNKTISKMSINNETQYPIARKTKRKAT